MSTYQAIDIKRSEASALKEKKETSWKSLVLLGLVVFAGVILLSSSYSSEKQNNTMKVDELLVAEDVQESGDLEFAQYGFQSLADDMENVDLTDVSQLLSTLSKHGALDIADLGTTSTERTNQIRAALTGIINKLNAEKTVIRNDYNKREQERLAEKAKAKKAATDANAIQLARKRTYDSLQGIANGAVATYNRENAEDKRETDQIVADLTGVIAQINRLSGYVPNVNCQVNEAVDFTVAGWSNTRNFAARKVHGYFDSRSSRVVGKTFSGLKSSSNKVEVSFRLLYAHTPDREPIIVDINGRRVYTSTAVGSGPTLPAAERNGFYPSLPGNVWYRNLKFVVDLPANGQIRVNIGVLFNQNWPDEAWFFDNFKICDYGEPAQ